MKKAILLICAVLLISAFYGCASTNEVQYSNPAEYEEFPTWEIRTNSEFWQQVSLGTKGFKLPDREIKIQTENGEQLLVVYDVFNRTLSINIADFLKVNPDFPERVEQDKKYTLYLSYMEQGNIITGYSRKPVLDDIYELRTLAEIEEEQSAKASEELVREQAEKEAKELKQKEHESKGLKIAGGYVYHGIEEAKQNATAFASSALETGHAYYIEKFYLDETASFAAAGTNFITKEYKFIKFVDERVRVEVTAAALTSFGYKSVSVVVLGGDAPMYTPIVLGLVE